MEHPFKKLSGRKVKTGRFVIVQDQVLVNGKEQPYDYLEIKPGVCILPIKDGRVILQKQYRYPVQSWEWELPGGFIDAGETAEQAAVRELKEETGCAAKRLVPLGAFYPSFGSTDEKIYLFLAFCGNLSRHSREPGEVIELHEISIEEMKRLIASGSFMHGAGLAAWARYISGEYDKF
ncbi:MAG: NUDIX hydrolase [Eubacteriales bacterium]|nr:NUDIX hydrolase [Eubacteriales bacterium]